MKNDLRDTLIDYIMRNGSRALGQLSVDADASVVTLNRIKAGHLPRLAIAYRVAKATGRSDREAKRIAETCSCDAKKTKGLKVG